MRGGGKANLDISVRKERQWNALSASCMDGVSLMTFVYCTINHGYESSSLHVFVVIFHVSSVICHGLPF